MKRVLYFALFAMIPFIGAGTASACSSSCGAFFTEGSNYPYVEAGLYNATQSPIDVVGNSGWVTVAGCSDNTATIRSTGTFDLAVRAYVNYYTTSVLAASRYEIKFELTNASTGIVYPAGTYGHAVQPIVNSTGQLPTTTQQPKGEWYHGYAGGLPAGNYRLTMSVRLLASGTLHFGQCLLSAQGTPWDNGAYSTVPDAVTVGSTWVQIGSATFTNKFGGAANVQVQGYFEIESGTPFDSLSIGFTHDGLSSGSHNLNVYVPSQLPDGVHLRDHLPNEALVSLGSGDAPGATHTIEMWARNNSGHTTTVQYREVSAIGLPAATSFFPPTITSLPASPVPWIASSGPTSVTPSGSGAVPVSYLFLDQAAGSNPFQPRTGTPTCGNWTLLGEFTIPANVTGSEYTVGDGYIEFLGRGGNTWSSGYAQIGVQVETPDLQAVTDFHFVGLTLPDVPRQIPFFLDAASWGMPGDTVRLYIRKVTNCGWPNDPQTFSVGKVYLGLQTVYPSESCLYHP